jgi:hypothetical protein
MLKKLSLFLLAIILSNIILSCSDDDSNPASSSPEGVGTYEGSNSMNKPMLIIIGDIDGKAWVTKYSIDYEVVLQNGTASGTSSSENTVGIVEVKDDKFEIQIGSESNEVLTGSVGDNKITGTFSFVVNIPLGGTGTANGSYTINKK